MAILVALLASVVHLLPVGAQGEQCFPETNQCISGRFQQYWQANGGLPVFGFPITAATNEQNRDTGQTYLTQYFERNRFELHPENQAPYDVLLGRLGDDRLRQQGRDWQTFPKADPSAAHYFAPSGHAIAHEPFWRYWSTHGLEFNGRQGFAPEESLALFGLPISEPAVETNASGDTILTQHFERARFEDHGARGVLLGLLGNETRANTPPPAPLAIRGQGTQATAQFDLGAGIYLAEARHTGGTRNFIVWLVNARGEQVELVANEIGEVASIKAIVVREAGRYLMNVTADGSWEITLRRPTAAEIDNAPQAPAQLSGTGDRPVFVKIAAGLTRFEFAHTGESNFIVWLRGMDGALVDLVANEIGNATGSKAINVPRSGTYLLDITAGGTWTINVAK